MHVSVFAARDEDKRVLGKKIDFAIPS